MSDEDSDDTYPWGDERDSLDDVGSDDDDSDDASYLTIDDDGLQPDDLQSEDSFLHEEDAADFHGISKHHYRSSILPLKDDDAPFLNYTFHSQLSRDGKIRLGRLISSARSLKQLHVKFQEEDPQSVDLVFSMDGGAKPTIRRRETGGGDDAETHALRRFKISGDDNTEHVKLLWDDWFSIAQYLAKAPSLRHLDFTEVSMASGELQLLAPVVEHVKLKTLSLTGIDLGDDEKVLNDSMGTFFARMNATKLNTIEMVGCNAEIGVCHQLSVILCKERSTLEVLNLDNNRLDDDCVEILCRSLAVNATLQVLHISDNEDISNEGWKLFEKLVYDTSSLEAIYQSNHTLERVVGHPCPHFLNINEGDETDYYKFGHAKIIHFLTKDSVSFNIESFGDLDVKMMPHVLGFFANPNFIHLYGAQPQCCLYQILRQWNMPELFSFPSAENVRLSAKMNELKEQNYKLQKQNHDLLRQIEQLRSENSRLTSENGLLKPENLLVEREGNSKRTRLNR